MTRLSKVKKDAYALMIFCNALFLAIPYIYIKNNSSKTTFLIVLAFFLILIAFAVLFVIKVKELNKKDVIPLTLCQCLGAYIGYFFVRQFLALGYNTYFLNNMKINIAIVGSSLTLFIAILLILLLRKTR